MKKENIASSSGLGPGEEATDGDMFMLGEDEGPVCTYLHTCMYTCMCTSIQLKKGEFERNVQLDNNSFIHTYIQVHTGTYIFYTSLHYYT